MKDLNITINSPWFSDERDIEEIREYTQKTFGVSLEDRLGYICLEYLGKAQDQVHEQGKVSV